MEYPIFLVHFWTNERVFKRVNLSLRLSWTLLTLALKPFVERLLVQRGPKKRTRAPVFVKCWCVSKFVPLITYRLDPSVDLRDGRNSSVAFWSQVLKIKFLLKLFIVYFIWEGKNEEIKIYVFYLFATIFVTMFYLFLNAIKVLLSSHLSLLENKTLMVLHSGLNQITSGFCPITILWNFEK